MAQFQLLTGYVNLGGDRNNVVFRGADAPMTFPETQVLAAIHGGDEHVHGLVDVGDTERDPETELERLVLRYGAKARELFPMVAGRVALPERDDRFPSAAEEQAAQAAADTARAAARAPKAKSSKTAAPVTPSEPDAVPSLDNLPG